MSAQDSHYQADSTADRGGPVVLIVLCLATFSGGMLLVIGDYTMLGPDVAAVCRGLEPDRLALWSTARAAGASRTRQSGITASRVARGITD